MKFNSQICTTREQSERLLALGLQKETADCTLIPSCDNDGTDVQKIGNLYLDLRDGAIPAYSLPRLIEMALRWLPMCGISFTPSEDTYEKVIEIIELQINDGNFPKEYLQHSENTREEGR